MYRGLDSYRALAFLAVFAFHCGLLPFGHLGVQAFFVLSGYLLIPILIVTKENSSPRYFFINFYGRRSLRIFPLYYLYLFVILIISLAVTGAKNYDEIEEINRFIKQVPWALTYTYNFFYSSRFFEETHLVTHFWSLAVEEQFYLVLPIVIFLVNKKHLKTFLLVVIILGPVLRLLIAIISSSHEIPFLSIEIYRVIYALAFSHLDAFAIGGYFALYQKSDNSNTPTLLLLCFSILVGYFSQYLSVGKIDFESFGYWQFMPYRYQYIWGYSLVNFVFAKIIIQFKDDKFFPALFNNIFLNYLGKTSYGLYVFHFPIIWLIGYANPSLSNISIALISIILTICVSSAIYELYEKRFLILKEKLFSKSLLPSPATDR